MVAGLIVLGVCILGSVALICFKGINITYRKNFTVKDTRYDTPKLTFNQIKTLEKDVNNVSIPKVEEETEPKLGPMDSVIGEIQELFGPEKEDDK